MYRGSTESVAPRNNERGRCYIWPQEWQPGRSEKPGVRGLVRGSRYLRRELIKATGVPSRPRIARWRCRVATVSVIVCQQVRGEPQTGLPAALLPTMSMTAVSASW